MTPQELAQAWYERGEIYFKGQDYKKAKEYYEKSANQGYAPAQHDLGWMYEQGRGVPQNYVHAHKWFNLSAAGGIKQAAAARDKLKATMNSDQIGQAQQLAQKCLSSNYQDCE